MVSFTYLANFPLLIFVSILCDMMMVTLYMYKCYKTPVSSKCVSKDIENPYLFLIVYWEKENYFRVFPSSHCQLSVLYHS